MSNETIDLKRILHESRETLINPQGYFSGLCLTGGYREPVIKAAVYGVVAGLFSFLWSIAELSPLSGTVWSGGIGIMVLLWSVIGAVMALFIGGAILLVISSISKGNADYEANVRVTASLMVIYPINAFLTFLYSINITLSSIIGFLVSLFSVYLLYHALTLSLKGKESSAKIVALALVLLILLGQIGRRRVSDRAEEILDMYEEQLVE